ncbi:MAG TPA: hypothetical protein ENJ53_04945 [Phaeodactylibacter sp.]|nr:hypothetical protein [Phaeodactylibacter sp.]
MKYIFYIFFVSFWVSCTPAEEAPQKGDVELAQVFNKKLYLSQLVGMIPDEVSKEDSIKIIHAEVERWTRETLLMHEAEKNIPQDLNIDGLVMDYRMSLIRHNYEQFLVETQLDSVISEQELNNYYEKNKEQYQLQSSILRCLLIKVPKDAPNLEELKNWWPGSKPENFQKMKNYATQYATFYILGDSAWYSIDELRVQLPKGVNFNPDQNLIQTDNQFQYFFKVLEKKSQKEIAPLAYIQEQAKKVILHKRKMVLLDKRKEQLYERETSKRNVKIFTN